MTDAEIIKAWECIAYHKECSESEECPYYMDNYNMCDNISLAKDVLDIYNRQKAKIEKCADTLCKKEDMEQLMAKERQQYYDELQAAKAEIERLTINMNAFGLGMKREKERADTAKAEAIKEFAERLKKAAYPFPCAIGVENAVTIRAINDLVKEMVGDTE